MKLLRKIKHNEKGSHIQGQGYNQGSKVKSSFCNNLKPTEVNFIKFYSTYKGYS